VRLFCIVTTSEEDQEGYPLAYLAMERLGPQPCLPPQLPHAVRSLTYPSAMLLHGPEAYAPDVDGDTPYLQIAYSLCCKFLHQVHSFWRLQHVVLAFRAHANDHA